jgi:hypothetical protein
MLAMDLSPYVEALLRHPAVRQARMVDGLLAIEAETAAASWELDALPRGPDSVDINILCHLISVVTVTEGFWSSVACCF